MNVSKIECAVATGNDWRHIMAAFGMSRVQIASALGLYY